MKKYPTLFRPDRKENLWLSECKEENKIANHILGCAVNGHTRAGWEYVRSSREWDVYYFKKCVKFEIKKFIKSILRRS